MRSPLLRILTVVLTGGAMLFTASIPAQQRRIDISGKWRSNVGREYIVEQAGKRFSWRDVNTGEEAEGTIDGDKAKAFWPRPSRNMSAEGRIISGDRPGWAVRIEWSNGVVFIREQERGPDEPLRERRPPGQREAPPQPGQRQGPPPPEGVQIGGTWYGNNKLVYEFIQHGNRFDWHSSDGSRGDGFFTEDMSIRTGFPGGGVALGHIVIGEPPGGAVAIEWQNGLIMARGQPPGGERPGEVERERKERFEGPPNLEEIVVHAYALKEKTYNVWIKTGGPLGGLGYDVRYRENNARGRNTIYVTDNYSGVNRSEDGGATWYASNKGIAARFGSSNDAIPVFSLTVDPNKPDNIWCGLKDVTGAYKSTDGGNSWTNVWREHGDFVFRGFTILQGDSNVVFAAGEIPMNSLGKEFDRVRGRVYRTGDGGQTWNVVWQGDNLTRYILINPANPSIMYVSTGIFDREAYNSDCSNPVLEGAELEQSYSARGGVGILKSSDGGDTWSALDRRNGLTDLYVGSLVMHPTNPEILLAGCGNNAASFYKQNGQTHCLGGVFLTNNGGKNWIKTLEDETITSVEFAPSDPKIAYAGGQHKFHRSSDGGKTWQTVNGQGRDWGPPGVIAGFPIDILVDPEKPDVVFVNNYGGGNLKSTDGGKTWTVASKGYTGAEMFDIDIAGNSPYTVFAAARSGAFRSTDGGENWEGLSNQSASFFGGYSVAANPKHPTIVIASTELNGRVYRSTDSGSTWVETRLLPVTPGDPDQAFGLKRIVFAPSDPQVVYAGSCRPNVRISKDPTALGIYKSSDGGVTWAKANTAQTQHLGINNLAVHPKNHNIVYAATLDSGLWKTTNGGTSWTRLQGLKATDIRAVAIRPDKPEIVYAGVNNGGVYVSFDGGSSWAQLALGMEANDPIFALVIDPAHPDIVWAGSDRTGVYRHNPIEQRWFHFNKGLHTRAVTDMAISKDGTVLYATTFGEGVFRLEISSKGTN